MDNLFWWALYGESSLLRFDIQQFSSRVRNPGNILAVYSAGSMDNFLASEDSLGISKEIPHLLTVSQLRELSIYVEFP